MTKTGPGTWFLDGTNTYTGQTVASAGSLFASSDAALGSTAGNTVVNSGGTLVFTAFTLAEPLVLNGAGTGAQTGALNFNGANGHVVTGPISLGSDATAFTFLNGATIAGTIALNGHALTLGGTLVTDVSGVVSGPGDVVGTVNMNQGTLTPGVNGPGLLSTDGASFTPNAGYDVFLNGLTPGFEYSQLEVDGNVALNDGSLDVALNFTPAVGDSFIIVNSSGTISGTFKGLPDGATLTVNGAPFVINYVQLKTRDLQPSSQVILTRLPGEATVVAVSLAASTPVVLAGPTWCAWPGRTCAASTA